MRAFFIFLISALALAATPAFAKRAADWRAATEKELKSVIPERAPVGKERIETEFRTASGVTDGKGRFIAGVVMITAGYEAEGKYSHFFITQAPIKIGDVSFAPGEYVFGYQRLDSESIRVMFYEAADGKMVGAVKATIENKRGPIRSLLITPPGGARAMMQIGRFILDYSVAE